MYIVFLYRLLLKLNVSFIYRFCLHGNHQRLCTKYTSLLLCNIYFLSQQPRTATGQKHIFVFSWNHNRFFFTDHPLSCPLISCQRRKVQSQGVSWPGWQFILLDFNQSIKPSWAGCFERSSALEQSGGSISCPCQHRNEDWLRTLMLDVKHQASITCNVATSTPSGWCWSEWSLRRR